LPVGEFHESSFELRDENKAILLTECIKKEKESAEKHLNIFCTDTKPTVYVLEELF